MDLISILATVILTTTIATVLMGLGAYWAFKLRDKRRPARRSLNDATEEDGAPVFLDRYLPSQALRHEASDRQ